jgi:hypothetical protein
MHTTENTHLGDETIFSLQPPFHWQDRVSRPFIAAILSLGRRSWPLFHANPKLSTVSSQDQWLRLNELGHLRYDAKTRAPVLLLSRRGQEPHFYCEDGTATHSSPNEPNQMCILVSNLACWVIQLKLICLLGFSTQATPLVGLFSSSLFACWVSRLKQPRLLGYSAQAYLLAGFLDKQQTQLKLICLLGFST